TPRPVVAPGGGERLVSRWTVERTEGQKRFRAPLRASDVRRFEARRPRIRPLARVRRRDERERHDELGSDELLRDGTPARPGARSVARERSHGVLARRADAGAARGAAGRGEERAPSALRELSVRS